MVNTNSPSIRAAIYARVSTTSSQEKQSTRMQLDELQEYCVRHQWTSCVYEDNLSGKNTDRPGFQKLMRDARAREFDILLVWKIDRLSRSLQDFVLTVTELSNLGVRFIATTQGIDTDKRNPAAAFLMQILAAMAEFERSLISERVKAGIARAKARGGFKRKERVVNLGHLLDGAGAGLSISQLAIQEGVSRTMAWRRLQHAKTQAKESKGDK